MKFKVGGSCPFCKVGKIIIKTGKFSDFLACDMYRHTGCNFAKGIKDADLKDPLEKQADHILDMNNIEYLKI